MNWRYNGFMHALMCAAVLATAACGDAENTTTTTKTGDDKLAAIELVYEDVDESKNLSFQLDPWLANYPIVARKIREEKLAALAAEECDTTTTCLVGSEVSTHYRGERLISLIDTTTSFYGGAHPSMKAADMTFDLQSGDKLRFGEVFSSWPAAREMLQIQWCDAVKEHSTCPPIEEQALALSGGADGISGVFVKTSDYAFGNYAEGSDDAYLAITPELLALAKPEYQPYFTLEVCC